MGARKSELDKFKLRFEHVEDRRYINVEALTLRDIAFGTLVVITASMMFLGVYVWGT